MLIAPFLGEMVGDELNNKNFDFGKFRHANDMRLPGSDTLPTRIKGCQNDILSLRGLRFGTPCTSPRHANDTFDTRHFWGAKKISKALPPWPQITKMKCISQNRLRNTLEIKGRHFDTSSLRGAVTVPLGMCW